MKRNFLNAILLIACASLLGSCFSSKKIKNSASSKTDSTGVSKTHNLLASETDSSGLKTTDSSYNNSITVNFGNDADEYTRTSEDDAQQKAIDLAGPETPVKKKIPLHTVNIDGKEITSTRPISSININVSGKTSTVDIGSLVKRDTANNTAETTSNVSKQDESKDKQVEKSGSSVFIYLGIGAMVLLFAFFGLRYGVFFVGRKKNNSNQTT